MKEISVIIPTHAHKDREQNLLALIKSLLIENNLDYIKEIIIIDNGCTLPEEDFNFKNQVIKIIKEPEIGLNKARNCGIKNAKGSILAFVDDDVIVSKNWAENIFKSYNMNNIFCVGGPVLLSGVSNLIPRWLSNYFTRFLFPPRFPNESGVIKSPYYLIGANMSFRRKAFDIFGLFDSGLDRKGNNLLSNGDTEFIIRLPKDSVWYSEGAKVQGIIKTERFTRSFMIRRLFWQGISDYIMFKKRGVENFYDADEIFLSKGFIKIIFNKLIKFKFFEIICMVVRILGFSFGKLYIKKGRG